MSTILKLAIKGSEIPPVQGLKDDILAALLSPPTGDPTKFAEDLAEAISQRVAIAVQDYLQANVRVVVAPGIAVATTGVAGPSAGATTSPGAGVLVMVDPPAAPSL